MSKRRRYNRDDETSSTEMENSSGTKSPLFDDPGYNLEPIDISEGIQTFIEEEPQYVGDDRKVLMCPICR